MSIILEEMLDDENDILVDDMIDNEEIDLSDEEEEENDLIHAPVGVEYDEEEEYEDPYITYDVEEEEPIEDDEEYEDDLEDEDFFVTEAASMDIFAVAEQWLNESLMQAINEAEDDEAKKQAAVNKVKEMRAALEKYGKRGYNRTKIKEERDTKEKVIVNAILTGTSAGLFALAGISLPVSLALSAFIGIISAGEIAVGHAVNKQYNRIYTEEEINKLKAYSKKAYKCSSYLNKKAESEKDSDKAKRYKKTAGEYKKLAKEFDKEVEKSINTKKD